MDKVVVVLGMHRSGTSALTRGLEALAIDLGPNLKPAVASDNEVGFFEDAGLSAINDEILALSGSRWDMSRVTCLQPAEDPRLRRLRSRACDVISSQFGRSACFAFKDPRTCRTLPFWQDVIAELKREPVYVLCFRNPLSTVRSLAARDDFPRRKSYWLWLLHMLEAVRLTAGARRAFVAFETLLAQPGQILGRLETLVGDERVRLSATGLAAYAAFLRPSLVHHHASREELASDAACPDLVRDVYALLLDEASGSDDAPGSAARWAECIRTFRSMAWLADVDELANRSDRPAMPAAHRQRAGRPGPAAADPSPAAGPETGAGRLVFFTICSLNYLALARTLFRSLRRHYPDAATFLALADDPHACPDSSAEPFTLIRLADLDIAELGEMVRRYGVIEFNTAIKPFVFRYLLEHADADSVVYLDPDIYVNSAMPELESALAGSCDVVLTPHLLEPAEHAEISDIKMLQFGIFNLGFLGLRNSPEAHRLVDWWGRRTVHDCRALPDQGLYLDQKWADLFPAFVSATHILRHPGYNVAYWNLNQREVVLEDGQWLVNGHPLRFVHFAGQKIDDPTVFSRHSSEFDLTNIGDLAQLHDTYRRECLDNGHLHYVGIANAILAVPREPQAAARSSTPRGRASLLSKLKGWRAPTLWTYQQHPPRPLCTPRRPRAAPRSGRPRFAIATATRNRRRFLRATIDSVLEQDYPDLSYAVQDCESQDGTAELLADYGDRVSWRSEPDSGQADAINRAFSRISGDVMACINADDTYLPGALHYVARLLVDRPGIDVIYGHRIYIDAQGLEIGRGILPPHDEVAFKWVNFLPSDTAFWRRRVWDAVGPFDNAFNSVFAWDFFLRAQARGFRFHRAPIFLTCYRIHDRQKSHVDKAIRESESEVVRRRSVDGDPAAASNVLNEAYQAYLKRQARFDLLYRLGIVRPG